MEKIISSRRQNESLMIIKKRFFDQKEKPNKNVCPIWEQIQKKKILPIYGKDIYEINDNGTNAFTAMENTMNEKEKQQYLFGMMLKNKHNNNNIKNNNKKIKISLSQK